MNNYMGQKIPEQLTEFIKKAQSAGKSQSEIKSMLLNSGWDDNIVSLVLDQGTELLPPPPPAPKSSGREIFFYLLQFFTLGTAAIAVGSVIFALINKYFSDEVVGWYYPSANTVTGALSSLIVALPVFLVVSWKLIRDTSAGLASVRSGIRRILTYLALFFASATVIGDVIALVYRFLSGEVDTKFLLKVITILLIGGWVIIYFYITVKRDEKGEAYPANWHRYNLIAVLVVFIATVSGGFVLSGTPQFRQRLLRDQQRIMELQNIQWQIQSYYERIGRLPVSLEEISTGYVPKMPQDPLTGQLYEYIPSDSLEYKLCAVFETDDKQTSETTKPTYYEPFSEFNWSHPAGPYCFELKVISKINP